MSTSFSLNDLTLKCHEIYDNKKNIIIGKIDNIYKLPQKSQEDVKQLNYLQILNANIDRQIRETERITNGLYEACLLKDDIPNPYNFIHPALGDHFYGRGTESKRLEHALIEGRSIAIYGLQRIGKTSLVENVINNKINSSPENIVIQINMFDLAETCLSYINFLSIIIERLSDYFGTDYKQTKDAFSIYLRETDLTEIRHGFEKIITDTKHKLKKKRFILFIDEFQDIVKAFEYAKKKTCRIP